MVCHTYSENFLNSKNYVDSRQRRGAIKIDIHDDYEETEITIHARKWTEELEELIQKLEKPAPKRIVGYAEDKSILLSPHEIDYVFVQNRKVFACCGKKV